MKVLAFFVLIGFLAFVQSDLVTVSGVIRDFWPCTNNDNCGKYGDGLPEWSEYYCNASYCMPDFESFSGSGQQGIVLPYLDSNRKPIYNNATYHSNIADNGAYFPLWWNTAPGYNLQYVINITLDNTVCFGACPLDGATYGYKNESYFPLAYKGFGNFGPGYPTENFSFCLELHLRFTYRGVELFSFTGDDDLWVFINDALVIDLGGLHSALSATVQLNTTAALSDLVVGQNYPFDMFYCERHTSQSDLALYTDLALTCPYYDWCGICQGNGQSCCTCDDGSVCTTDTCNVLNGTCIYTQNTCPGDNSNLCNPQTCDPITGCSRTTITCDDHSNCTTDSCNPSSGCQYRPITCNDHNTCTSDSCNMTTGCVFTPLPTDLCTGAACVQGQPSVEKNCTATDLCRPQACANNTCVVAYVITCNDGNNCTQDICMNGNCTNPPVNCSDSNVCTLDACVNGTCTHANISCDDGNACTNDFCDPINGCYYTNITFDATINCTTAYCDKVIGIVRNPIVCLPISKCSCVNNACVCKTAFFDSTGAKIGAGVIAAVIIAGVVALIAVIVSAKKGYDYYQHAHSASQALGTNPMYVDRGDKGQNPFYAEA